MKIGLISDTHIPRRAKSIPNEFLKWFKEERVNLIIHCGDINEERILEELRNIAKTYAVKGNTDFIDLPKELTLNINKYKIFIFHSDIIYPRGDLNKIYKIGREKNANIVIFGHTHIPLFTYYNGIYFINPGTATGVRSGEYPTTTKSVAILEINNGKIKVKFKILTDQK